MGGKAPDSWAFSRPADPPPNTPGLAPRSGWYDSNHAEVADKCAYTYGTTYSVPSLAYPSLTAKANVSGNWGWGGGGGRGGGGLACWTQGRGFT